MRIQAHQYGLFVGRPTGSPVDRPVAKHAGRRMYSPVDTPVGMPYSPAGISIRIPINRSVVVALVDTSIGTPCLRG